MKSTSFFLTVLLGVLSLTVVLLDRASRPQNDIQRILVEYDKELDTQLIEDQTKDESLEDRTNVVTLNEIPNTGNALSLKYALAAAKRGDIDSAERSYRELLAYNPNHQAAGINLGLLLKKAGRYEEALAVLTPMVDRATGRRKGKTLALLADTYGHLNNYSMAAELFQKSIEYRPSHKLSWINLAKAQQAAGLPWKQVSKTYSQAVSMDPKRVTTRLAAAEYEFASLNAKQAIKLIKEQYKRMSRVERARELLVWSYLALNKYKKASLHVNWLIQNGRIEIRKSYLPLVSEIGDLKNEKGLLVDVLKRGVSLDENLTQYVLLEQAKIFSENEQKIDDALTIYEGLMTKPFKLTQAAFKASLLAYRLKLKEKAYQYIELAIQLNPSNSKYRREHIKMLLGFGDANTAYTYMERLLKEKPKSNENRRLFAEINLAIGEPEKAISLLNDIPNRLKKEQDYLLSAKALIEVGNLNSANESLMDLLEVNGKHVEGRVLLASNLCKASRYDECQSQTKIILKLDQGNKAAIKLIGDHHQTSSFKDTLGV